MLRGCFKIKGVPLAYGLFSPTHKRTEGRAAVWGSEFTIKAKSRQQRGFYGFSSQAKIG